jgi:serine/threonine protein kinase
MDIWALGCITYTIIDGLSPFYDETEDLIKENILNNEVSFNGENWVDVTPECKEFIKECLNKDPKQRPSAEDLNDHAFI